MDPFTELIALAIVAIGIPVLLTRMFCRSLVREIASWAPSKASARRKYHLLQVIPPNAKPSAPANWWPTESWPVSAAEHS